ncbi:ferredoxin [Amycolatopsis nigrescens]|uniref:ferredoxin n=1 Tax=Amycolatopsis nigrescens TaxID=381445 RepID=UPI000361966E|nr:ferredoxin [Amycolatopsis nigrescens]
MRIEIDRESCIGAGMCALTAPDVFDQDDDDGQVVVLQPTPPADAEDQVREAVELCPASVIRVAGG